MTATDATMTDETRSDELARLQRRVQRERAARMEAERISERITRDLYDGQRDLALLVDVTRAANDASDLRGALARALTCICEHTGWPIGHVFLIDADTGELAPSAIWHLDRPDRHDAFRRATEETRLASGESLGGRVLASGQPLSIADVTADETFAQTRAGVELGVRGAFGFPILVESEVVGVMEFFSDRVETPGERLLDLMAQIGTELGRAIERERARVAEDGLRRTLAARAAELERSNADLEQFASIASHDLQEPLRKVRTFSQRVVETESAQLSEQGADYLQRANSAAARMQTLIEDLLAFSRVSTRGRPFTSVDLAAIAAAVVDDLENAVERSGATVELGALPTVDADGLQMRQLMQNLISNALKFRDAERAPVITVSAAVDGDVARITVADNGIGFDPEYRERIFRVFERLHGRNEYEGTGIGLALCRKIVLRHGGTVDADGVPGEGSTFTVGLPLRQPLTAPEVSPRT